MRARLGLSRHAEDGRAVPPMRVIRRKDGAVVAIAAPAVGLKVAEQRLGTHQHARRCRASVPHWRAC